MELANVSNEVHQTAPSLVATSLKGTLHPICRYIVSALSKETAKAVRGFFVPSMLPSHYKIEVPIFQIGVNMYRLVRNRYRPRNNHLPL